MSMRALAAWALAALTSVAAAAGDGETAQTLTADQIVERNVAARGGLEAWRKVQTPGLCSAAPDGNADGGSVPHALESR